VEPRKEEEEEEEEEEEDYTPVKIVFFSIESSLRAGQPTWNLFSLSPRSNQL
jgi:hypothetical protein